MIGKEIGDAKFCILVDEARDESKREQMVLKESVSFMLCMSMILFQQL
jgi:hypothetical protein